MNVERRGASLVACRKYVYTWGKKGWRCEKKASLGSRNKFVSLDLINPPEGQAQKELISGTKDKKYWHE